MNFFDCLNTSPGSDLSQPLIPSATKHHAIVRLHRGAGVEVLSLWHSSHIHAREHHGLQVLVPDPSGPASLAIQASMAAASMAGEQTGIARSRPLRETSGLTVCIAVLHELDGTAVRRDDHLPHAPD